VPANVIGNICLALIFITFFYKESRVHRKQKIDWFGAITLVGAVIFLST
jgi:hypothetical protein